MAFNQRSFYTERFLITSQGVPQCHSTAHTDLIGSDHTHNNPYVCRSILYSLLLQLIVRLRTASIKFRDFTVTQTQMEVRKLVRFDSDTAGKRLRLSRGTMLTFGTKVRGFKIGWSRRIFQGEKILSTPSFGREVKPFVPSRIFVYAWKSQLSVEITGHFSPK